MSALEEVYSKIEGYRFEIIEMQRELTCRPALGPENGGSGEHDKADYVKEQIGLLKPDVFYEVHAPDERAPGGYRPNLVAVWNGSQAGDPVWVLSHLDIVPPQSGPLYPPQPTSQMNTARSEISSPMPRSWPLFFHLHR